MPLRKAPFLALLLLPAIVFFTILLGFMHTTEIEPGSNAKASLASADSKRADTDHQAASPPPHDDAAADSSTASKTDGGKSDDTSDDVVKKEPIALKSLNFPKLTADVDRQKAVRDAFMHAWKGYKKHAWGHDELRPISRTTGSWGGFGMTILDSLDTIWLMGLTHEFEEAATWVENHLNLDKTSPVSTFEITIRALGGLLSAAQLSGRAGLLQKATDLGERLMTAFDTPFGLPYSTVDLAHRTAHSASWMGGQVALSEAGTTQMEFLQLARMTGQADFAKVAQRVTTTLAKLDKPNGLASIHINLQTGQWAGSPRVTLGALGDSFFEYLLKIWLFLNRDSSAEVYKDMYRETSAGILKYLLHRTNPSNHIYLAEAADRNNPTSIIEKMDELVCFAGGMFALGAEAYGPAYRSPALDGAAEVDAAQERKRQQEAAEKESPEDYTWREKQREAGAGITAICHAMMNTATGLPPEIIKFSQGADFHPAPDAAHYLLRPEAVEAMFYLYRITGEAKYRSWAWQAFQAIEEHCRVPDGYSGVKDVRTLPPVHDDLQQSFFLAETLKYLYLIFSSSELVPLDRYVFNTEAHPFEVFTPPKWMADILRGEQV